MTRASAWARVRTGLAAILLAAFAASGTRAEESALLMFSSATEPGWMPRILAKLQAGKGSAPNLEEHVLFRNRDGTPTFLALLWHWPSETLGSDLFELYRITTRAPDGVSLRFVREVEGQHLEMAGPTGRDIFGDGVPAVFLDYAEGGSMATNSGMMVFRLTRFSVDVTPFGDGATVRLPQGKNGVKPDLIGYDYRWAWFFRGCGSCGTLIHVPLMWQDGRYMPACRRFPFYYEDQIALDREYLAAHPALDTASYLEVAVEIALRYAQLGEPEAALAALTEGLDAARRRPTGPAESFLGGSLEKELARVEAGIRPVLEAARAGRELPCPLLAYGEAGELGGLVTPVASEP